MTEGLVHAEELVLDQVTGRCAWALRHIPSGTFGDPYDWSLIIVRDSWDSREVEFKLCEGMDLAKRRAIQVKLVEMGFTSARASEPGKEVAWNLGGRRKILSEENDMRGVKISMETQDSAGDPAMRVTYEHFFKDKGKQLAFQEKMGGKLSESVLEGSLELRDEDLKEAAAAAAESGD